MNVTELATTFNATHEEYARIAPLLWDPPGAAMARHTAPAPGDRILDACCGIGSSALPAAQAVGPDGHVDAVDIAGTLLTKGRAMAECLGLTNIRFIEADVTSWKPDGERYDLVQCAFGVFLLPDLDRDTAHLISLLRPGGRFGVTVWAKGALESIGRAIYEVATRHRPEQDRRPVSGRAIERIDTEPLLDAWLTSLGLHDIRVHRDAGGIPLTAETSWALVLGSGFRGLLAGFDATTVAVVRTEFLTTLAERGVDSADTTVLTGIGHS
jgi:SAM-dependent methyltransferase